MGGTFGVNMPNVGGLPADWNRVIIDGVVGNEVGNSGMNAQMVNLDAIAEVRLLNNSYRAEYGQSGGSQLQIVTRGGSAQYHGSAYYYGRHERFNSTEFFRARSQRLQGIDPFPPKYRFATYGANAGGPVLKNKKSLFFFYSIEAPQVERPQSVQTWRMPSALERQGDFSQTFDAQGRLINIRDPRKTGQACSATTGGPGCFDGNIIPASMINSAHMQAMLRLMPLPEYDPRTTQGNYNYDTEEVIDIPKMNNVARIDWRPTQNDSFSFTIKDWWQDQRGARITAGPSNWQWFFAHYKNTDRGFTGNYTKILRSNFVWDTDFGSRQQTEVFYPLNETEWTKASRTDRRTSATTVGCLTRVSPGYRRCARTSPTSAAVTLSREASTMSTPSTRKGRAVSAAAPGLVITTSPWIPRTGWTPTTASPMRCSATSRRTRRPTASPT
jgi:hypothetical protein